ncbi:hypothetical protein GCM10027415_09130 [Humibacter ginsengisoli]
MEGRRRPTVAGYRNAQEPRRRDMREELSTPQPGRIHSATLRYARRYDANAANAVEWGSQEGATQLTRRELMKLGLVHTENETSQMRR